MLQESLAFTALQYFHRFVELIIHRVFRFYVFLRSRWRLLLLGNNGVICHISNNDVGRDRRVLDRLAARRIIFRHRENQCATIGKIDRLLDRAIAEGLVPYNVAACIFENRSRDNLSSSRRTPIDQDRQRAEP